MMGLKPKTLWLLLLALVFGVGVLVLELTGNRSPQNSESKNTASGTAIFAFTEDDVERVQIKTPAQQLVFERSAQAFPLTWTMTGPEQGPADEAAIAFLLSQLAAAQSERSVKVQATKLADYGLAPPRATIQVTLKTKKTHTLVLGKANFNESALYAQVDPPETRQYPTSLELLPKTLQDAVSRPLADWKSQPAANPAPFPSSAE